ncbi:MAG: hypothetical protein LBE08_04870 [Bifidobacteriaceae bacterium]|jgi:hypothetical protein|nr:hypothetical protein [Bifidobacteriaceae bacterium]
MRRLVWLTLGVGLGVGAAFWAYRRLEAAKRAAREAVTPEGLTRGIDKAVALASGLADEISAAAKEREAELRRTLLQED